MRTKLLISVGFAVAFAAGLMGGWQGHRLGGHAEKPEPPRDDPRGMSVVVRVLGLSEQQREQFQKIWSETGNRSDQEDRRRQLRKQRDEVIASLVPTSQRAAYDAAQKNFADAMAAMDEEVKKNIQNAVDRTHQILTPEQAKKYDEMLARNPWGRPGREPGHGGPGGNSPGGNGPGGNPPAGNGPGGNGLGGPPAGPDGPPRDEDRPGQRPPTTESAPLVPDR